MITFIITLSTALLLSGVAEYFSIMGLIAIFTTAPISVAVMGVILGVAKLVAASWVYQNWTAAPLAIRYYFTAAVIVLSAITSIGIYGYLSKAHANQSMLSGDAQAKIAIYDQKLLISKENIDVNRKALTQLNDAVDQAMVRSTTEQGADKAILIRKAQSRERTRLLKEIEIEQKKVMQLNEERSPFAADARKVEAEVGPIKYIAALMYGDNPDQNLLERAVRWVIIAIVLVFDPMAILLLIAANFTNKQLQGKIITPVVRPAGKVFEFAANIDHPSDTAQSNTSPSSWSSELYQQVRADISSDSTSMNVIKSIFEKIFRK